MNLTPSSPRIESQEPANQAPHAARSSVYVFVWLPAGKDLFGPADLDLLRRGPARLNTEPVEQPIARRLTERFQHATQHPWSSYTTLEKALDSNRELGSRRFKIPFEYEPDSAILRDRLKGDFRAYSNGLYVWRLTRKGAELTLDQARKLGLAFGKHHIAHLFDATWSKQHLALRDQDESGPQEEIYDRYDGILTYDQLDILLDGLFNIEVNPRIFFNVATDKDVRRVNEESYSVGAILNGVSLYWYNGTCRSLESESVDYSASFGSSSVSRKNGEPDPDDDQIDYDDETLARETSTFNDDREPRSSDAENFFRRLSCAAMEHFLRTAVTRALVSYREGVEYARKELVKQRFGSKLNRPPAQSRRTSLSKSLSTDLHVPTYVSLVSSKMPVLQFFRETVDDLTDVIIVKQDKHPDRDLGTRCRTLTLAEKQMNRNLDTIAASLASTERAVTIESNEETIASLGEIRKLQERLLEKGLGWSGGVGGSVNLKITGLQATWLAGILSAVGAVLTFMAEQPLETDQLLAAFSVLAVLLFGTIAISKLWQTSFVRRLRSKGKATPTDVPGERITIEFPRAEPGVDLLKFSNGVKAWRAKIPSLDDAKKLCGCVFSDVSSQVATGGVSRQRYVFVSDKSKEGSYQIQFDVTEYPASVGGGAFMTYCRITAERGEKISEGSSLREEAHRVVGEYVRHIFSEDDWERVRKEWKLPAGESPGPGLAGGSRP